MKQILIRIAYIYLTSIILLNPAISILSATTTSVIHGNAPELDNTSMDDIGFKLYLELDSDNSFELKPHTNNKYYIGANIKFSQIKSKFDVNLLKSHFIDLDGDEIESVEVVSESYSWKKNGSDINNTGDLVINDKACDSTTSYTYTFTVISNIKAKTKYGLPNESEIIPVQNTYNIDANTGVCYLRPGNMAINSKSGGTGVKLEHSYDQEYFTPTEKNNTSFDNVYHTGGFKYNAGFPTTAFKNAVFRIILSDNVYNASKYTFSILNSPTQISLKNNNQVVFNSKPDNKIYYVKITKSDNNFITFYPIKLESKSSWITPYTKSWSYNSWKDTDNPITYCKNLGARSPHLRELGNSEYVTPPTYVPDYDMNNWAIYGNGYYRTISSASRIEEGKGGIQAEWGALYNYSSANFLSLWYWTNDSRDAPDGKSIARFAYGLNQGNVTYAYEKKGYPGVYFYAVCIEDL